MCVYLETSLTSLSSVSYVQITNALQLVKLYKTKHFQSCRNVQTIKSDMWQLFFKYTLHIKHLWGKFYLKVFKFLMGVFKLVSIIYVIMKTYMLLCSSCFCEISALCVSWTTYDHFYYTPCIAFWALFGSLVPAMCNHTSYAQVHELPQSHCGDNRWAHCFIYIHIYIYYIYTYIYISIQIDR